MRSAMKDEEIALVLGRAMAQSPQSPYAALLALTYARTALGVTMTDVSIAKAKQTVSRESWHEMKTRLGLRGLNF